MKTTTYGQRWGMGPTAGKKAATYLVRLPDGTTQTKRSFSVSDITAYAVVSKRAHGDGWHVTVWDTRSMAEYIAGQSADTLILVADRQS